MRPDRGLAGRRSAAASAKYYWMLWKSMILPAECGSPTDVGEGLIEGGPGEAERNAGREGAAVGLGDHGFGGDRCPPCR